MINDADLPAAKEVLNNITVSTPSTPSSYDFIVPDLQNPKLPVSAVDFKDPLQFWKILSAAINENPPPKDQIDALLPMFRPLGIEFGKEWNPEKLPPVILNAMKEAAQEIGPMSANLPVGEFVNQWFMPPPEIGNAQTAYYLRAIVARIGLTANTPKEAIYFMTSSDNNKQNLMSDKKYTLTFTQLPPYIAPGFWSLTLYTASNNYNVKNSINRYALGSDNSMLFNPDGSLTIYIQSTSPGKGKESNWLPSGDGAQAFYLILRSYAPGQAMIDALTDPQAFAPPMVTAVN